MRDLWDNPEQDDLARYWKKAWKKSKRKYCGKKKDLSLFINPPIWLRTGSSGGLL
jgi:hypothetical protein